MKIPLGLIALAISVAACTKEGEDNYQDIFGQWDWKSSVVTIGQDSFLIFPLDSSQTLLTFHSYKTFESEAHCFKYVPIQGTYEVKSSTSTGTSANTLILNFQVSKDSFLLNITGRQMELNEIGGGQHSVHTFVKR